MTCEHCATLSKQFAQLSKEVKEYKTAIENAMISNTAIVNQIANNIEVKLDILCNNENKMQSQKQSAKKVKTKPTFFKDSVKENTKCYINILYTEDELTTIENSEDVEGKKSPATKLAKIAEMLYKEVIKNKDTDNKLKELYEEYKNSLDNEE